MAVLTALVCLTAAGCSSHNKNPRTGATPALQRVGPEALPPRVRADVARLRLALGPRRLIVHCWTGRRRVAMRRVSIDAPIPAQDPEVWLVGFRGHIVYQPPNTPAGPQAPIDGRYAYASYDKRSGYRLDFGVDKQVPSIDRPHARK